ncbi:TetR family transcriptional regulator [Halopseudomonas bauzanensis]|jgi:AcrR family transcriptional regulator|nr:TetR family transcriptional regulator [Halopseudomonas bauzanensis]
MQRPTIATKTKGDEPVNSGWRKKPKQGRSEATARAVLLAAEELFGAYGYQDTTLESIAARAGVGTSSIYDYFLNKGALALALLENTAQEAAQRIRQILVEAGGEELESSVPKLVYRIYQEYKLNKSILINLAQEVPGLQAKNVYSMDRLINRASLLHLYIHEDRFQGRDLPKQQAFAILIFTASVKHYLTLEPDLVDESEFLDQLSETMLDHLLDRRH